ncbi:hypothetical protein CAEBREN_08038 [Caenorhabditis brenneri]|uniref:Uncharacterized protein n=1 Tax=Caenorhabditis brenneri TaxID=135651 RepID=G0MW77_CAEBE|nr:hypothetical protein CAEBREN_08038 [Caenorhabditis brenneri]
MEILPRTDQPGPSSVVIETPTTSSTSDDQKTTPEAKPLLFSINNILNNIGNNPTSSNSRTVENVLFGSGFNLFAFMQAMPIINAQQVENILPSLMNRNGECDINVTKQPYVIVQHERGAKKNMTRKLTDQGKIKNEFCWALQYKAIRNKLFWKVTNYKSDAECDITLVVTLSPKCFMTGIQDNIAGFFLVKIITPSGPIEEECWVPLKWEKKYMQRMFEKKIEATYNKEETFGLLSVQQFLKEQPGVIKRLPTDPTITSRWVA